MLKPAYNPTDRPVVIDDDGHALGGGEWGAVDPDADRVKALVDARELVLRDELPKSADPAVRDAVDAAKARAGQAPDAAPAGEDTTPTEAETPESDKGAEPAAKRSAR